MKNLKLLRRLGLAVLGVLAFCTSIFLAQPSVIIYTHRQEVNKEIIFMMEVSAVIAWIVLSVIAAAIARSLLHKNSALAFATGFVGVVAAGFLTASIFDLMGMPTLILGNILLVLLVPAFIVVAFFLLLSPLFLLQWLGCPGCRPEDQPITRREYEQFRRDIEQRKWRN